MKPCIKCKHSKYAVIGITNKLICTKTIPEFDNVYGKNLYGMENTCIFVRKSCEQQNGFEPRWLERLIQYF